MGAGGRAQSVEIAGADRKPTKQASTFFIPIMSGLGFAAILFILGLVGAASVASIQLDSVGVAMAVSTALVLSIAMALLRIIGHYVLAYALGLLGVALGALIHLASDDASSGGCTAALMSFVMLWMRAFGTLSHWILCVQEHPKSAAACMAEDAAPIDMPTMGGKGKTAVIVGGGVSGLSTAHFMLKAGFSKVVVMEGRDKVGGNNEPYFDDAQKEHATTCVFTSPSQQPHYLDLCREFGVEQTSHELETVDGHVVLDGKKIEVNMGGAHEVYNFLRRAFWQVTWGEIFDGLLIFVLLYLQYQLRPESATTVTQLLGPRLSKCSVFRDFYMGWVGVNVWCRFDDLDGFPAHSFATFIFEYACPLIYRRDDVTRDCCVLDGRLVHALEKANLARAPTYEQHVRTKVVHIRRCAETGRKHVLARRTRAAAAVPIADKAVLVSQLRAHAAKESWSEGGEDSEEVTFECDVVILATQPGASLAILTNSAAVPVDDEEAQSKLEPPRVPPGLPHELSKWGTMECFTFVHSDDALAKGRAWVHETLHNATSGAPYAHYAIRPRVGDKQAKLWNSYVYGREHAKDFVDNHVDKEKIVELLMPTLPIFSGDNVVDRNAKWRAIDRDCSDLYWTCCCRSGLQFHNNGVLCAKRVVLAALGETW